jgi:hypothetical protein
LFRYSWNSSVCCIMKFMPLQFYLNWVHIIILNKIRCIDFCLSIGSGTYWYTKLLQNRKRSWLEVECTPLSIASLLLLL